MKPTHLGFIESQRRSVVQKIGGKLGFAERFEEHLLAQLPGTQFMAKTIEWMRIGNELWCPVGGEPTVLAELKERLRLMHAAHGISPIEPFRLSSRHHIPQDHQSLLMHREAVRLILDDPSLVLKAQATLARWMETGSQRSMPLWMGWQNILEHGNWDLAVDDSELGRELRQASPLSTLLSQETRLEIIARVRRMQRPDE